MRPGFLVARTRPLAVLVSAARTAIGRSDLAIFMGGLGPTKDDLTREAVATALNVQLKRDHVLVEVLMERDAIKARYGVGSATANRLRAAAEKPDLRVARG